MLLKLKKKSNPLNPEKSFRISYAKNGTTGTIIIIVVS